jgi:hypothetical protein
MAKRYFTIPFLTVRGRAIQPPISAVGQARIYYNSTQKALMSSTDGYGYLPIGTGDIITTTNTTNILGASSTTLSAGDMTELTGATLVGGGYRDDRVWSATTFVTIGFVSRSGVTLTIQLWDATLNSEVASHTHTTTSSTQSETVVVIPINTILEVRIRISGTLLPGDLGTLNSAALKLEA